MGTTAYSITQSGRYEPFDLQVAREQITWHETVFKFGLNLDVGTSFETIWTASSVYSYLAAATVLKISSGSTCPLPAGCFLRARSPAASISCVARPSASCKFSFEVCATKSF